ncbi:MAG: twin-arginine translocation signal domain-containing protein [Sedimentisphaerales bacterium]|nr:twin-arginine translocation signal domain-containing protein [Sedimentisphaerales bacterium]
MSDNRVNRRGFIKGSVAASAGVALGLSSFEEQNLLARMAEGGSGRSGEEKARTPSATMPCGKIKNLTISRVFCGGNLIGGWAHSRDLLYVSSLVKAYHTDEKVMETFELAEERGINAVLTNPISDRVINRYWNERGGKIQWISDCAWGKDIKEGIKRSVDNGAHAVYVQGGVADQAVCDGKTAALGDALEYIKTFKVPGGLGAHDLETIKACVKAGFEPDFWVKTLHPDNYWSATPEENRKVFDVVEPESKDHAQHHDNMWCRNPQETIEYMATLKQPWIAFKVLAAGAVPPMEGFRFAFEGGADFLCIGMFDFQVREDSIIAQRILASEIKRSRPWCA